jgi:hypothetical protein
VKLWAATLHQARVVGELTVLQVAVSSATKLMLGCSPNETSRVEVMNEVAVEFWRLEELLGSRRNVDLSDDQVDDH